MEIIEAIRTFFYAWQVPISAIAGIVAIVTNIIRALLAFKNEKDKTPKPSKENQLGDCKAAQYINKRNLLIFQAKQDAKKRPSTRFRKLVSFVVCYVVFFAPLALCVWCPFFEETINSFTLKLYECLPLVKETVNFPDFFLILSFVWVLLGEILVVWTFLLLLFNVPSWSDFIEKGWCNFVNKSKKGARREAKRIGKEKIKEAKKISKEAAKEAKKAKKEAVKEAKKNEYYVHISRVIDVASHFDTYLLLDADPRDTDSRDRDAFLEDKVIGATKINKDESVCDKIESCPKEKPDEKLVVFIYSRHGKASHEQTKKARNECKYKYVYDLGPVCGDMRDLEIVAHQLYYLQGGKCLRLP